MGFLEEQVTRFGKHDMERLGIFCEMPYMNGKGYVSPFPKPKTTKGRNIMCDGRKSKNGTQHGYFDSEFRRLFIGEAIPWKKKKTDKKKKGLLAGTFVPPGYPKWHACPGDYHGTFGGIIEAMSRQTKKVKVDKKKLAERKLPIVTNPGKKGGAGYVDICFSKYPEHKADPWGKGRKRKEYGFIRDGPMLTVHCPQPYFGPNPYLEFGKSGRVYVPRKEPVYQVIGDGKWTPTGPAKWQGGCHAGLFSPNPEYKTNRDPKKEAQMKAKRAKDKLADEMFGKFEPQSLAIKKMYTTSVMKHNTDICVNAVNYKIYEPVYVKNLLG